MCQNLSSIFVNGEIFSFMMLKIIILADKHFLNLEHCCFLRLKSYHCSTCNKSFLTKQALDVHSITHLDKQLYACKLCNKTFQTKQNLTNHENVHSGKINYFSYQRFFNKLQLSKTEVEKVWDE